MSDAESAEDPGLDGPHDPQVWAAAHLGGDLTAPHRELFETHLLRCAACWAEVRGARAGRAWAEGLREPAPQGFREFVRAVATAPPASEQTAEQTSDPVAGPVVEPVIDAAAGAQVAGRPVQGRRRVARLDRRTWLSTAAALVAGAVIAGGLTAGLLSGDGRPGEAALVAAAATYRAEASALGRIDQPPVQRLGSMRWQGSAREDLVGQPATVYHYRDDTGRQVLLVSSQQQFARAEDARTVVGSSWTAQVAGTAMFCVDHGGLSWLVIADSRERAVDAGRQAGLA